MQRITISVSDEVHGWLRQRAKTSHRSLSYVAHHLLAGAMPETKPTPSLIPDLQEETKRIEQQLGKRTPPEAKSVWSVVCPLRNQHDLGEVCPHCGGSGAQMKFRRWRRITIEVSRAQDKAIRQEARRRGISTGELMIESVNEMIEAHRAVEAGTPTLRQQVLVERFRAASEREDE